MDSFKKNLEQKSFDVEHALSMYANSFCTLPAEYIYDKEILKEYEDVIKRCHIYMIGYLSKAALIDIKQEQRKLKVEYNIAGETKIIELEMPDDYTLYFDDESGYYVKDKEGNKRLIPQEHMNSLLSKYLEFDVRYIGQAYGKDGSRNALDRLLKHETLQKIALSPKPDNTTLSLLLLEIEPNNKLITAMNPFAKNKDNDGLRIKAGLDKLFNTTEQERISLFEAALIRYFYPQFNKEFKDSFPSTNLKVLQDCYKKDFSAVFAEIFIDELPFKLRSEKVGVSHYHCAKHNLHIEKEREAFFYSDS
ncbi:hypothetical protein [Photobacterium sanguinicancri]|uniref:hypothetical protein n=2 Tax=Photobacterium TaxID=657 RepID=UPI000787AF13|nr:hypothetical protein [Photobacterium sanguinicancri]KXI23211.1 hypothetical protein AS132_09085 [Photobacterium sanguinicancri]